MHVQHSAHVYLTVRMGRNRDYYSDAQREKKFVRGHSANDDSFIIIISLLVLLSKTATLASAQVANFSFSAMDPPDFTCGSGLTCLNVAGRYKNDSDGLYNGRLTPIYPRPGLASQTSGVIYYTQPVRLLDPSSNRTASFSTSYATNIIVEVWNTRNHTEDRRGDGMTFVLSADDTTGGAAARFLGIYNASGQRSSKTIVVEFDSWQNDEYLFNDINDNHVSIDLMTITPVASRNASEVNITMWHPDVTLYTWIDYSAETQLLEVRISRNASKPRTSFLNHTMNLFDVAEELMWAGFSAGNGDAYSHYYITDWVFNSSGIAPFSPSARRKRNTGLIVAMAVVVPVLALLGLLLLFMLRKRSRRKKLEFGMASMDHQLMMDLHLAGLPDSMSYKQLSTATRGFSDESKLGQGGFGSVYRGVLPASNTPVAVKRIGADSKQGQREFMAEVSIISQLRHRNLIQLVGWCMDRGKYLLVYELMPHGSLDKALFLSYGKESSALTWKQRFNIATGCAAALDYLHQGWKQQVIHRDVKASNIMLDDEWNAKLGDFGLARLVDHQGPSATTMVAGTLGYLAPEAAVSGKFTEKTDVFAFGAVMLEIACGRTAFASGAPADEAVLVDWVWQRLSEGDLLSVVDKRLGDDFDVYWMEVLILMGLLCSHPDPNSRPPIRQVVEVLAGHLSVPLVPVSKPSAAFKSTYEQVSIEDLYKRDSKNTTKSYGSRSFTKASMSSTGRSSSTWSAPFSESTSL